MAILKIKDENNNFVSVPSINGQDGVGVPLGGTKGQVLVKKSDTNYDTEWKDNLIVNKYKAILTENKIAGAEITIPCYYKVGADVLDVFLNGERLILSSDAAGSDGHYQEVGTAANISNKIKTTTDWSLGTGDVLEFVVRGEYSDTEQ